MRKKNVYLIALTISLTVFMMGCAEESNPPILDNDQPSIADTQSNTPVEVDISNSIKIDKNGFLPISTVSMQEILNTYSERFDELLITHENGDIDMRYSLDKTEDGMSKAGITFKNEGDGEAIILSYNFAKADANGDHAQSIRWGFDLVTQIFSIELTDDIWSEIMDVASDDKEVGAMGTDYEGYSNEDSGVRFIYADLGENIQIDIHPYSYPTP